MNVIAFDKFVKKELMEADGVAFVDSLDELYSKSDYLSLHIPANNETKKSIGYELLSKLPIGDLAT